MKNINIFVITHKQLNIRKYPGRKIIYVGDKTNFVFDSKTTFFDSTKNNISKLNPYYCELTALYWVWKNYFKSKYIGFEHYSRNFYRNFFQIAPLNFLYKKMKKCDVLHISKSHHVSSCLNFWIKHEGAILYPILKKSIKKIAPEYYNDWEKIMNGHNMSYCNMFICKWEIFDKYMTFLFDILNECYKNMYFWPYEKKFRSIGYMAERLLDVFILHNHYREKSCFIRIKKH